MAVPPPPLWQNLLMENPWPAAVVLLGVGVLLRTLAKRTIREKPRRKWLNRSALLASLLAAGVVSLAYAVETSRERVQRRTLELVNATAPLDIAAVDALLAEGVVVAGPDGEALIEGQRVRRRLETVSGSYGIESHRIRDRKAWARDGRGMSSVNLYTEVGSTPALTRWWLRWERGGDGRWRVAEVRWLSYQGQSPPLGVVR